MNKKIILALILSTFLGCSSIPKINKNEMITPNNISTDIFENQKLVFSNVNWYLSMRTHKQELCVLPALKELISVPCAMILVQRWVHME